MKHNSEVSYSDATGWSAALGYSLSKEQFSKIEMFLELLVRSAAKQNLIGPSEYSRLWPRHILESIAFIKNINGKRVVDIGTGAGFPGFVLAICGFDVVMVESRRKRCAFLETAARLCGVACEVRNSRIEETLPFPEGTVFTSRAVKKPIEMLKLIEPVVLGSFTLVTRVSEPLPASEMVFLSEPLPTPPLDRTGYILQYRHLRN